MNNLCAPVTSDRLTKLGVLLPFSQRRTPKTWVSLGKLRYFKVIFRVLIIKFAIFLFCNAFRFAKILGYSWVFYH
jgi:hypothetical protein